MLCLLSCLSFTCGTRWRTWWSPTRPRSRKPLIPFTVVHCKLLLHYSGWDIVAWIVRSDGAKNFLAKQIRFQSFAIFSDLQTGTVILILDSVWHSSDFLSTLGSTVGFRRKTWLCCSQPAESFPARADSTTWEFKLKVPAMNRALDFFLFHKYTDVQHSLRTHHRIVIRTWCSVVLLKLNKKECDMSRLCDSRRQTVAQERKLILLNDRKALSRTRYCKYVHVTNLFFGKVLVASW